MKKDEVMERNLKGILAIVIGLFVFLKGPLPDAALLSVLFIISGLYLSEDARKYITLFLELMRNKLGKDESNVNMAQNSGHSNTQQSVSQTGDSPINIGQHTGPITIIREK